MRIVLWRGHHSPALRELTAWALEGKLLVIPCPPELRDFSFVNQLPEGRVECQGDWEGLEVPPRSGSAEYPSPPCLGVFTSATTEAAKLVLYTRENVESCAHAIFSLFDRRRIASVFCYPQPYHTFGLTLGYAAAHFFGWDLHLPEGRYSRPHHEEWLAACGPGTLTLGTPTHFHDLADFVRNTKAKPRASYSAIVGGARVAREQWLILRDLLQVEAPSIGYGATEASPGVSHLAPGVEPREDGEVGLPLSHLRVAVDPLTGVTFEGPSVCSAIVENGAVEFPRSFTLPDLLRVRADGTWVYEGRAKFTLNRGGKKILLEAVEKEILAQFGIEALGFSVPCARLGEELGLLLKTSAEDLRFRREEFVAHLRARYGMNFSGEHLRAVGGFPLNANLKPDRRAALAQLSI